MYITLRRVELVWLNIPDFPVLDPVVSIVKSALSINRLVFAINLLISADAY
jgi:hypothetical protein